MRGHEPKLQQHVRGQWFVRWGGRQYWLGRDKAEAERIFLDPAGEHPCAHVNWAAWRLARAKADRARSAGSHTFAELVEAYLATGVSGRSEWTRMHAKGHLRRATHALGRFRTGELSGQLLQAFQTDLMQLDLARSTIRHDLEQVRACIRWGCRAGLCPTDLLLQVEILERIRVKRTMPKYIAPERIAAELAIAERTEPLAAACCRLCYLAIIRPMDAVHIAQGPGDARAPLYEFDDPPPVRGFDPHDRWLLVLHEHKTSRSTGEARYVVMSPQALACFDRIAELRREGHRIAGLNDLSKRMRRTGVALRPKMAQKAATTQLGYDVPEEAARQAQGKWLPHEDWRYRQQRWPALLAAVARLSL